MQDRPSLPWFALALLCGSALAAVNLNTSRSNNYRLTWSAEVASAAQAQALLVELDRLGATDEAQLRQWLTANLKRFGIDAERLNRLIIVPRSRKMPDIGIILLFRPEDEADAMATTVNSSKSTSSDGAAATPVHVVVDGRVEFDAQLVQGGAVLLHEGQLSWTQPEAPACPCAAHRSTEGG